MRGKDSRHQRELLGSTWEAINGIDRAIPERLLMAS
jgi:hypothetical protein